MNNTITLEKQVFEDFLNTFDENFKCLKEAAEEVMSYGPGDADQYYIQQLEKSRKCLEILNQLISK